MRRSFFPRLAAAAAVVTYLLIIAGGIVRVTGSGLGCGVDNDWPLCNGGLLPPLQVNALIEFSHRWIAALATLLVAALAATAWISRRQQRRVLFASSLAAVLFLLQIALGALTVKYHLPGGIVMIHLANALLLLGVLTYIAIASRNLRVPSQDGGRRARSRSTALAAGATYVLALSGALVVETGSSAGCSGWPLCGGGLQFPATALDTYNLAHRIVAGVVVLVLLALMFTLVRDRMRRPATRFWAGAAITIAVLQVLAGALIVELRLPPAAQAVHVALASALWASVLAVAVLQRGHAELVAGTQRESPRVDARPATPAGAMP